MTTAKAHKAGNEELAMLTVQTQGVLIRRDSIDAIVARARRERDAELVRLVLLGVAALRRMSQRALAALRSHGLGSAHHA
jgi:hypothetical protein